MLIRKPYFSHNAQAYLYLLTEFRTPRHSGLIVISIKQQAKENCQEAAMLFFSQTLP
jgi:hypothetical protein